MEIAWWDSCEQCRELISHTKGKRKGHYKLQGSVNSRSEPTGRIPSPSYRSFVAPGFNSSSNIVPDRHACYSLCSGILAPIMKLVDMCSLSRLRASSYASSAVYAFGGRCASYVSSHYGCTHL